MSQIKPVFVAKRQRFTLEDDGHPFGAAHYRDFNGADGVERVFFHTTVDDDYSGRGLAGVLVKFALENTIAEGATIVPVCPYVKAYTAKHPEYQPHLVQPTPAHLEILPREE